MYFLIITLHTDLTLVVALRASWYNLFLILVVPHGNPSPSVFYLMHYNFYTFLLKMEEEFGNLKEKLEVSELKCGLLTDECNKLKHQLEGLLRVKEVRIYM